MGPDERALLKAAGKGDVDSVRKQISNRANIDAINEEGHSALTVAISRQQINIVKLLIENGAAMDRSGFLVHKPLHVAVATRNLDLVKLILETDVDINETTTIGSVLLMAVKTGQESMVTLLLAKGADVNIGGWGIKSPLHQAVQTRQEKLVPMLLKHGAEAHNTHSAFLRRLSLGCKNLFKDWVSQEMYSEHAKTIHSAFSDQMQKEEALISALCYAIEHNHKEVHSIFLELPNEFAIPVAEKYEYSAKSNN